MVPEFARTYLEHGGRIRDPADLVHIAHEQILLEVSADTIKNRGILCDTDMLVIYIWSKEVFNTVPVALNALYHHHRYDYTLLCAPDIPWVYDPHRVNPLDRNRLYTLYKTELLRTGRPFTEIRGNNLKERCLDAEKIVTQLLKDR